MEPLPEVTDGGDESGGGGSGLWQTGRAFEVIITSCSILIMVVSNLLVGDRSFLVRMRRAPNNNHSQLPKVTY